MSEIDLIEKAKKGNKSALNMLLTESLPVLKGYIIKMTGDINLSQDIVQDTMLKAVLNINKFEPKARFTTWLIKISTNVYRDYLRKNKQNELIDETMEDKSPDTEEKAIADYEYKEIVNIINKLPPDKRSVFILKHYYGYKYEEIAQILDCPTGTVRSRLHYAIDFIIKELERKGII